LHCTAAGCCREAITVSDAPAVIADVIGQPVKHNIDRNTWIEGSVATGGPAEYGEMLRILTETLASGHGSQPNNDVHHVTGVPPISLSRLRAANRADLEAVRGTR